MAPVVKNVGLAGAARAANWLAHGATKQNGDFLNLLGIIFARTRSPTRHYPSTLKAETQEAEAEGESSELQ